MWTIERVRKELDTLAKADGITIDVPVSANGRLRTTLGRVRSYRSTCLPISIELSSMKAQIMIFSIQLNMNMFTISSW